MPSSSDYSIRRQKIVRQACYLSIPKYGRGNFLVHTSQEERKDLLHTMPVIEAVSCWFPRNVWRLAVCSSWTNRVTPGAHAFDLS
jgi:hypothetical protein